MLLSNSFHHNSDQSIICARKYTENVTKLNYNLHLYYQLG